MGSILTAAARLVAQTPLDRLSTSRIAEVAGVSVGSLYQYFHDKHAIISALIERKAREDVDQLMARVERESDGSLGALLRSVVETSVEVHRRNPALYAAILPLVPVVGQFTLVRRIVNEARERARVELDKRRDELRDGDLELMTFVMTAAIEGLVHAAVLERPELLDDTRFVDEVALLVTRYVASS